MSDDLEMPDTVRALTRPFLVVYVAWHPDFVEGEVIAKCLYQHYRRDLYENVTGGAGLSVIYRSAPALTSDTPLDIDFNDAETSAIIILLDSHWAGNTAWVAWARDLADRAEKSGLSVRVFPVAIERDALRLGLLEQAIRWDTWITVTPEERRLKLIGSLTYQFSRMLRHYLAQLKYPTKDEDALPQYLNKVAIFLSHSKHDPDGEKIAKLIRDYLYLGEGDNLASFFDVHDIPTGLRFNKVILEKVKVSAVVAIHTDSYSSREWCRREIIEAKRWSVPLVVANCVTDIDERSFPYMGNVPLVRIEPNATDRIQHVVRRLLDEVLKDFLWRCQTERAIQTYDPDVTFLPRPPELISLAALKNLTKATLVYPDPPIGAEEQRLFEIITPGVRLRSMTEWLAEITV